jgi:DNA-binding transcriptional LysR family regulator
MADLDPFAGVSIFVAAARAGSFTQAADQLGITKSAVGKSIARLELRLGVKLFHRTTRMNRLTVDGEAFHAACAAALEEITGAEAALTSARQTLTGRLRIDMPVAFGRSVLLPLLLEIVRPHPGLRLTLSFTDETIDPLLEDVDLAIRFGDLKDSSHLIARHLATQARVICAAPSYLTEHGVPAALEDLRDHRGVVGAAKGPPVTWVVREDGIVRRIAPPTSHRLNDGEAMVAATVGGLGLCQAPISMVRDLIARGALRTVLEDYSTVPVEIHALWPRQAHLSPRVRHVVDRFAAFAAQGRLD